MRDILLHENLIHPFSQPQDYIKLIFQSEFGPGHLIADAEYSKKRLLYRKKCAACAAHLS